MKQIPDKHLDDFISACHKAATYGLLRCSSGNLSKRIDKEIMLLTPTRTWIAELAADQIVICNILDGSVHDTKRPSAEIGFHAGIMRIRSDVSVILHFQSPYATALSCRKNIPSNFSVIPEIPFYIGPVTIIPYLAPGSTELADAVVRAMNDHDLVVMRNHGQVVVGKDYEDTFQKALFFELACEIILRAGSDITYLSPEAIANLREKSKREQTGGI